MCGPMGFFSGRLSRGAIAHIGLILQPLLCEDDEEYRIFKRDLLYINEPLFAEM